jgi:gliding motility-associated-like protein
MFERIKIKAKLSLLARIIFLSVFLFFSKSMKAPHIVGGYISYRCLGGNEYEVTLKIYRDCFSGGAEFDQPASIFIFGDSDDYDAFFAFDDLVISPLDVSLNNPCLIPPEICIEEGVYTGIVTLPNNIEDFYIVYQRCCRNPTIDNLDFPGDQGITLSAYVPAGNVVECNSSPVFANYPPLVLCLFDELVFDHSATDLDGDSLVYELCSPYLGLSNTQPTADNSGLNPPTPPPFSELNWLTGYSESYPMASDPALSIDPTTGLLTGTPNQLGQYVVGICVSEYRDGVLLSTSRRDFQFNVTVCDPVVNTAIGEQEDICNGLTIDFTNNSEDIQFFYWEFGDETTLTDTSNLFEPTYTYPDTGIYEVTLIGNPGYDCADTTYLEFEIYNPLNPTIFAIGSCQPHLSFDFDANGTFNEDIAIYSWNFGANAIPSTSAIKNPQNIVFNASGSFDITLTISDNGCTSSDTYTLVVPEPIQVEILPQLLFCSGFAVDFEQESDNATNFLWNFGVGGITTDYSSELNPTYSYPGEGTYNVQLIASALNNCSDTAYGSFIIFPLLNPSFERPPTQCLEENQFNFQAGGEFTGVASFQWTFEGGNPASSSNQNPSVSFSDLGYHIVTVTVLENNCIKTYTDSVRVDPNPIADFTVLDNGGCEPFRAIFDNLSTTASIEYNYLWNFGDGSTSNDNNPDHIYENAGVYDVSLLLTNITGCLDDDFILKSNLITVQQTPIANFSIEPQGSISIFDPTVNITNLAEGSTSCNYTFLEENVFDECDFEFLFQNTTSPQPIIQIVSNDFGCASTITKYIRFTDHVVYVPTAFTPNGDGINDILKVVAAGVTKIHFEIFDRFGQLVFESFDIDRGWDGTYLSNQFYAMNGVYNWRIRIADLNLQNQDYRGSTTLIR